jgi:hypothetical protein
VKVTASKGPLEWPCSPLIARLEGQQAPFKVGPVGKVARRKEFALDDRKVDLDLVEPTGVDRRMDQNNIGPLGAEAVGRWLTTMEEPLSAIGNTRRAKRYGCRRMI